MGKPFSKELDNLQHTYDWALEQDICSAISLLKSTYHLPLLSVGSGGSLSAAEFHASLHRYFFRSISMALTPVELISAMPSNGKASVWTLSASGNNIDIRRAFQHASVVEPRAVSALVGRKNSKLKQLHEKYHFTNFFEYPLPAGKDGFLATNSLLAFCVLLYRIYSSAAEQDIALPSSIDKLLKATVKGCRSLSGLEKATDTILRQNTLHVVYSSKLKSTAIDIESKFIEAGLGSVHLADVRNFAHGRHHWFSKNPEDSGILFITTDIDAELAKKTSDLLPDGIAKYQIVIDDKSCQELIAGVILSLYLTLWRGSYFNIDPGKPGVPSYGSKIYRLSAKSGFLSSIPKKQAAINRKTLHGPIENSSLPEWEKGYKRFTSKLSKQAFLGLVLDYDGTVVDSRYRKYPPKKEICAELNRLLKEGMIIGFATGRGKSIREALQTKGAIAKKYWGQVIIGYYNGSEIAPLSDNNVPNAKGNSCAELERVTEQLDNNLLVKAINPDITLRLNQVTVESRKPVPETYLWESVQEQIGTDQEINVVRSSHSIDILASHVTKVAVIERILGDTSEKHQILTIGDRGRWPGNDSQLLHTQYSLSVDEVSHADDRCWNLCAAGVRGPQGTLEYLRKIHTKNGLMYFG